MHQHAWMDKWKYGWMEKPLMEGRMLGMDGIWWDEWKEQLMERVKPGFWDGWMMNAEMKEHGLDRWIKYTW